MSGNKGGRPNLGVGHVDHLVGSPHSKERLKAILQTILGELSVAEASEELGISPSRFAQLRESALFGALSALEPRPPGRPRTLEEADVRAVRDLEAKITVLEKELVVNEARAELAIGLGREGGRSPPVVPHDREQSRTAPEGSRKRGRRRRPRRSGRRGKRR